MVVKVEQSAYMRWDAFLEAEAVREYPGDPQVRNRVLEQRRKGLVVFREVEWPQIRQALARDYGIAVPQGLEPHWTASGQAVLWQQAKRSVIKVIGESPNGAPLRALVEEGLGWQPTSSVSLNNASTIAHYLKKGLRLRPPAEGVEASVLESAVPADALQRPDEGPKPRTFECLRHNDLRVFVTWKAYVQHCAERKEPLEETPPPEVYEIAKKYTYWCYAHNRGFNHKRLAARHMKAELAKPGRSVHLSLEQMEMRPKIKGA